MTTGSILESPRRKELGPEVTTCGLELSDEVRTDSGALKVPLDLSVFTQSGDDVFEDILRGYDVAFHADDLGNLHYAPRSVTQARLLENYIHRGTDLLSHGLNRQFDAGHQNHHLETAQAVTR